MKWQELSVNLTFTQTKHCQEMLFSELIINTPVDLHQAHRLSAGDPDISARKQVKHWFKF